MTQPAQPWWAADRRKAAMATGTFSISIEARRPAGFQERGFRRAHHRTGGSSRPSAAGCSRRSAVGRDPYAVYLELDFSDFAIVSRNLGGDPGMKNEKYISLLFDGGADLRAV